MLGLFRQYADGILPGSPGFGPESVLGPVPNLGPRYQKHISPKLANTTYGPKIGLPARISAGKTSTSARADLGCSLQHRAEILP